MRTEVKIEGADCTYCLNDTVAVLRGLDGVEAVSASITDGCIAVDHELDDPSTLARVLQEGLHGTGRSGNEVVMTSVEPVISLLHCSHR